MPEPLIDNAGDKGDVRAITVLVVGLMLLMVAYWFVCIWRLVLPPPLTLQDKLKDALRERKKGNLAPLEALAAQGLLDAAVELFTLHNAAGNDVAALEALKHAVAAKKWFDLQNVLPVHSEYDRRRLLGIGTTPDYNQLAKEWRADNRGRELQLAWLLTFGPEDLRDLPRAWLCLCLLRGRAGDTSAPLPSHSLEEIRDLLLAEVPEDVKEQAEAEAKRITYAEWVAGK